MDEQNKLKKSPVIWIIVVIVLIGAAVGVYFFMSSDEEASTNTNTTTNANKVTVNVNTNTQTSDDTTNFVDKIKPPAAQATTFAEYEPVNVNVDPQVQTVTLAANFSNIHNLDQISFLVDNESTKKILEDNQFLVRPGWHDEFYSLYEGHRYNYTPSFITVDSLLHNYHLLFDHLLKKAEENYLIDKLKELNATMLAASQEQYNELKNTDWENAAKRNVAFFTVASVLLDDSVSIPSIVQSEVQQELNLISAKGGISEAIVINIGEEAGLQLPTPQGVLSVELLKEDYSQYIPRGHYNRTEELSAYFKSMMWLGRMTFRLKSADETASAALITQALLDNSRSSLWDAIYEPTNFFVGKSDDITYYDLKSLLINAYGENPTSLELSQNTTAFEAFHEAARQLDPPQINSIPIFESSVQPDREKEIQGFRFMGQRFTVDASIMQRLVCRDVGNKRGTLDCGGSVPDSRMLPKGLDIAAAMGSAEAYDILNSYGETEYFRYPENMKLLQDYTSELDTSIWTQNIYWGWMYALKPLTVAVGDGYPEFMQNSAWIRKDLNSYLGSWTELKHDTILYAKQVYAELGAGPPPQYDDRGYVEPQPEVFARLAALTKMTREGLTIRDLISDNMKSNLEKMETLATSLTTIAEKELNNESRTDEEYEMIRSYGGQLEHFWLEVHQDDMDQSGQTQDEYLHNNPAALVADVATDPNGSVLEEAIGKIDTIYVVVEVEGVVKVAQGGIFSYYEFPWPMSDRLTDQKWRDLLNSENRPDRPDWTNSFLISD